MMTTVAVMGASPKPERYSYRAIQRLLAHGHQVIPIARRSGNVDGLAFVPSLGSVSEPVDTVTMYVGAAGQSATMIDEIIAARPRRVIFNPGAENPPIYPRLEQAGIAIEERCTLIMLGSGEF